MATYTDSHAYHPLSVIGREVTDEVIPPVCLQVGGLYMHPEDGKIKITDGYYRDPVYGRVSNFWTWTVVATGETKRGYGGYWPAVKTG